MTNLPMLLPILTVGVVIAVLLSPHCGRWLRCPTWAAALLVISVALVGAVTLTPQDVGAFGERSWPFTWILALFSDRVLNVMLFVPLGVAVMLVGRRALRFVLIAAALLLPWVVEGTQGLLSPLARDSQWQDVVDNCLGVAIGLIVGWVLIRWLQRSGRAGAA